jgi:hypothetical protein
MRLLLAVFAWTLAVPLARADDATRLAVIGDADDKDLAALVTTELSSNPAISLIERDELAKIGDELKLQQLAGHDAVALGKLANADGLIFIDKRADGSHVRFTAVNLGYALFDDPLQPGAGLPQQAKALGHLISNDIPKLKLDPAKAIPLSVLNLHADYATADSAALERNLTLLLESRLAAVPEYIVLERRHAWSLGFEHALDPAAQPLLQGAYLLDGSLSTAATGDITATVRIRNPHGPESSVKVQGRADNLPDFASQLLAAIQKTIGGTTSAALPDTKQEAQEYLREGMWGRRSNALDAALESLDSAELLGAHTADVEAVRIPVLYALANQGMEHWYPGGDPDNQIPVFDAAGLANRDLIPAFDAAGLAKRADAAIRAMRETTLYRNSKLEGQIDPALLTDPMEKFLAQTSNLEAWAVYRASKVLVLLDRANAPRADELRQAMRGVTDYDPLHGNPGRALPTNVNNGNSRADFADNWAQTLDEELAYYRLVCSDKIMAPPYSGFRSITDRFCARFLKTPEERHQGFVAFVDSLKDKTDSRVTYCLLRISSDDPAVADAAYKDFLGELWNMRESLAAANTDRPLFQNLYPLPDTIKIRDAAAGLPLLHYLLTSPKIDSWSIGVLRMLWQPRGFSAADAPQLWTEFKACRDLLGARWKAEGHGQGLWYLQMGRMEDEFKTQFPKLVAADAAPALATDPTALTLTKFWQPGQVAGTPKQPYLFGSLDVCADGVWVAGAFNANAQSLFHVNLENFATRSIAAPPVKVLKSDMVSTSQALYFVASPDESPGKNELVRYDLKAAAWQTRPLPDFHFARIFSVNDQLYLFVSSTPEESSIVHYDWDADQWNILTSNRRRPAHNQFDDAPLMIFFDAIFAGPNHSACLNVMQGVFTIREDDGPWPEAFDGSFSGFSHTIGDRTLICSEGGEAVVLDANSTTPEYWVANSTPHFRQPAPRFQPAEKAVTPWAAQANWIIPSDKKSPWHYGVAFHDETLYVLEEPKAGEHLHLLCYRKGDAGAPRRIPLQFHLDDATRAQLSFLPTESSEWMNPSLDLLEHPETMLLSHSPVFSRFVSTHQGICLQFGFTGFWFLSFADIDAYLASTTPK